MFVKFAELQGVCTQAPTITLACTEQAKPNEPAKKKGNKPMCYDCDCCDTQENIDVKKLDHATDRVRDISSQKRQAFRKQFNIDADNPPTTFEELIERINDKKYTIKDKSQMSYFELHNPLAQVIWRSPDAKPDQKGFDAAYKALEAQTEIVEDLVTFSDDAGKLKAIQDFTAWQPTAAS